MRISVFLLLAPVLLFTAGCAHSPASSPEPAPDLNLADFFKRPVGPKGLEPTPELLAMNGKRAQIKGYMVKEEDPVPGLFMLTPMPVSMAELADGPSDFLPPATLFVHLPKPAEAKTAAYRPGIWTVTGTLELGAKQEANERVSYVRLIPDNTAVILAPEGEVLQILEPGAASVGHHHH
jgi:hypothetical protein